MIRELALKLSSLGSKDLAWFEQQLGEKTFAKFTPYIEQAKKFGIAHHVTLLSEALDNHNPISMILEGKLGLSEKQFSSLNSFWQRVLLLDKQLTEDEQMCIKSHYTLPESNLNVTEEVVQQIKLLAVTQTNKALTAS